MFSKVRIVLWIIFGLIYNYHQPDVVRYQNLFPYFFQLTYFPTRFFKSAILIYYLSCLREQYLLSFECFFFLLVDDLRRVRKNLKESYMRYTRVQNPANCLPSNLMIL